ncbi:hypothetical protein FHETE_9564 [Fusarium heterosporum]|uniref:Uncharacterized protein n=1 Tax=Fusarium heterosporum TaxID=42747 RepID=A0A8H5SY62_FUSHE|nr:hypothetical protein FHETE_9564 [Fusarium heterosporum]
MKFLTLITIASFAVASPLARQQTVTGTISNSISIFSNTVPAILDQIDDSVVAIKANTDAAVVVQLQALVEANFEAIAQALNTSTTNIVAVTTGAVGGVAAQAIGLTQAQIVQLTASLQATIIVLQQIRATVSVTITDLTPALRATFQAEIDAVIQTLGPFIRPLLLFAVAVRSAAVTVNVVITGLDAAIANLLQTQSQLVASIGITPTTV